MVSFFFFNQMEKFLPKAEPFNLSSGEVYLFKDSELEVKGLFPHLL